MDSTRFDRLAKVVGAGTTRRAALTLLASLGLGGLGLDDPSETWAKAKTGTCKPACGVCETCDKGDCKKTRSGKKRCKKGKCKPRPDGTVCTAGTCQSGSCTAPPPPDPNACTAKACGITPDRCGPAGSICACLNTGSPGAPAGPGRCSPGGSGPCAAGVCPAGEQCVMGCDIPVCLKPCV